MDRTLRLMGTVTRPHGVRGEVKVRPETDDPARFDSLSAVYLGSDEASATRFDVRSVAFQPFGSDVTVILGLVSVDDREGAERLAGSLVLADQADMPPLAEGEFFLDDLIGIEAVDPDGAVLGRVIEVLDLPAQPVLVLERPNGRQAMIPFVDEFVEAVDPDEQVLILRPIDGLLDPDDQEVAD